MEAGRIPGGGLPGLAGLLKTDGLRPTEGTQTGSGVVGSRSSATPDSGSTGGSVLVALASFLPRAVADFETRLAEITDKLKDVTSESETDRAQNQQESKRLNIKENQERADEAIKKYDDAKAKQKNASIWDKIGMAFQGLAALAMIVAGAALIATGAGAGLGAMMIAGGVMMALSLTNSIMAMTSESGMGIGGQLARAFGADEEAARDWDQGVAIGLAVAAAVIAIATVVVTFGASAPAAIGAMQSILGAVSAGAAAGSAVTGAVSASIKHEAAQIRKEAMDKEAENLDVQAFMQMLDDLIDQAMQIMMGAMDRFNAMMDTLTEMSQDTMNSVSTVQFTG